MLTNVLLDVYVRLNRIEINNNPIINTNTYDTNNTKTLLSFDLLLSTNYLKYNKLY